MKKILILSIVFVMVLLTMGMASAHWRTRFGFGLFLPPPVVWAPPRVVYPSYPAIRLLRPWLLRASGLGARLLGESLDSLWMDEGLDSRILEVEQKSESNEKGAIPQAGIAPLKYGCSMRSRFAASFSYLGGMTAS